MDTLPDRPSGRAPDAMRAIQFDRGYTCLAEGSVLVSFGLTKGDLYGECERWRTRLSAGEGRGVVDRRVRYVAALYRIADGPGGSARQAGWQNG